MPTWTFSRSTPWLCDLSVQATDKMTPPTPLDRRDVETQRPSGRDKRALHAGVDAAEKRASGPPPAFSERPRWIGRCIFTEEVNSVPKLAYSAMKDVRRFALLILAPMLVL